MKFEVFAMRDQMTGFMTPTFEVNENVAIRNFKYALNKNDLLYANAKHFDFYKIGEFDTETGELGVYEPELICTGLSVLESKEEK